MPEWITVPNALTLLRLGLVPWIGEAVLRGRYGLALALFSLAAFTDFADGVAARRLGQVSRFGARLDPIADKFLLSGVFLSLGAAGALPWWLVGAVFGRDLCILLGAALLLRLTPARDFPPSVWGKASTLVQSVTGVAALARAAFPSASVGRLAALLPWPCAALTLWSGAHYAWRGVRLARNPLPSYCQTFSSGAPRRHNSQPEASE